MQVILFLNEKRAGWEIRSFDISTSLSWTATFSPTWLAYSLLTFTAAQLFKRMWRVINLLKDRKYIVADSQMSHTWNDENEMKTKTKMKIIEVNSLHWIHFNVYLRLQTLIIMFGLFCRFCVLLLSEIITSNCLIGTLRSGELASNFAAICSCNFIVRSMC